MYACSDDEIAPEIIPSSGSEIYFIDAMNFTSDGGTNSLNFSTNKDWTISVANTVNGTYWCTVSQMSGHAGDISVLVHVAANDGYDDRNVVITIKVGELSKTVMVTQKQKDALTLTTDRFEVGQEGGIINVEVKTNISYEVVIPDRYKDWITQKAVGRGLTGSSLSFEIAASKEYEKREGEIIIQSGVIAEAVKVYQAGGGIILLTQNDYPVSDKGETIAVEIKSNCEFEVKMPDVSWIAVTNARSVSSHTLYYTVGPNETYDGREAEIVFFDKNNSNISDTLHIRQAQKNAILLTKKVITIENIGGEFVVEVQANIPYEVEIPHEYEGWITQKTTGRGLVSNTLTFEISENKSKEKREGKIYLFNDMFREEIKIYQEGEKRVILLTQNEYLVSRSGENIQIEVKSNFDFEVKMPNIDWIHLLESKSISSYTFYFHIDYNPTYSPRTSEIIFYDKNDIQNADTLTIIQENAEGIYFPTEDMASHEISSTTKMVVIEVNSTYDDVIERIPPQATWIQLIDRSCTRISDILTEYKFTFYVEENTDIVDRTVNIWFERPTDKNVGIFSTIVQHGATFAKDDSWDGNIGEAVCAGGEGTNENPYLITKCEQLAKLAEEVNNGNSYANKYFRLLANLNFNYLEYLPIGSDGNPFSGFFDGNNKSVKYLLNSHSMDYIGLFGYTDKAYIENLTVWHSFGGEIYVGGIVGYAHSTTIHNCITAGSVRSYKHAGGIIGYAINSVITNSRTSASVSGTRMGGIVGYADNSDIVNCYSHSTMQGGRIVGGLVGYNAEGSKIMNSYNRSNFKGYGIIQNSATLGGIAGYNCGTIENCYSSGNIEVKDIEVSVGHTVGGLVGSPQGSSVVISSYFLKQHPVNSYLSIAGRPQGGIVSMCGTFNASGELSEPINYGGCTCTILSELLNLWVSQHNSSDYQYSYWRTDMAWPEFVAKK